MAKNIHKQVEKHIEDKFLELTFLFAQVKPGTIFHIKCKFSDKEYAQVLESLDIKANPKGFILVDVDVEVKLPIVRVKGKVKTVFERNCIKTLDPYLESLSYNVEDNFSLKDEETFDLAYINDRQFDFKDYLLEQIFLNFNQYPTKVKEEEGGRESLIVSDGLENGSEEKKNPFSVLKQLKSE